VVNVPHDFVVEGNFSETFEASHKGIDRATGLTVGTTDPKVHGYLPFGIAWYRKHFTPPASTSASAIMYVVRH
jgi:hypothetical protein